MKSVLVTALLALLVAVAFAQYEQNTAPVKQAFLWNKVLADNNEPADWPSTWQQIGIFTEDLWTTGEYVSDFFPEDRLKLIHSVGAIAKAKFVWNSAASQYTGLFQGADYGFVRASSAVAPGYSGIFSKTKQMTPGLSFKFLRNGIPSGNFFAMWQLDGQQDFNFFLNPLCNHVAARDDLPLKVKLLGKKFETVSKFPGMLGLSNWASYRQDGTVETKPNYPFALVFQPNPQLTQKFMDTERYDIPQYFSQSFTGNEVLYKVYAINDVNSYTTPVHIGSLQLASPFKASEFADSQMFFKHQFIEEDFVQRPDWLEAVSDPTRALPKIEGASRYAPYLPAY